MPDGGVSINVDLRALAAFGNRLTRAAKEMPKVMETALAATGPATTKAMQAVLPGQTGLTAGTIRRAVIGRNQGNAFVIKSHGGDIRLKFFKPRETSKGVTAAPWNSRRLYPATFMRSGFWPNRKGFVRGGQVLKRVGKGKYPLRGVRSGLYIPDEMITGNSASAFYMTVDRVMVDAMEAALYRVL